VVLRSADEALDFVRDTGAKTCRNPL
jgi:hypothetical protein